MHHFMNDSIPNMTLGGDLNIWIEEIGSNPSRRCKQPQKFHDGDETFELMHKLDIINSNNETTTIWRKYTNNTTKEYCVAALRIIDGIDDETNISHKFLHHITASDHYRNHIQIKHVGWNSIPKVKGYMW